MKLNKNFLKIAIGAGVIGLGLSVNFSANALTITNALPESSKLTVYAAYGAYLGKPCWEGVVQVGSPANEPQCNNKKEDLRIFLQNPPGSTIQSVVHYSMAGTGNATVQCLNQLGRTSYWVHLCNAAGHCYNQAFSSAGLPNCGS